MAKKRILTICLVCLVVVLGVSFVACSNVENTVKIQNQLVSRYGDGLTIVDSYSAPNNATEFKDEKRLKVKMNVDARMGGYHITGLYLPAGETLTISVSSEISQVGYRVVVDSVSNDRVVKSIYAIETKVESPTGGIVEIYVHNDGIREDSFDIILEGGVAMPYYRMGRDDIQQLAQGVGKYSILDCENMRFYVPSELLCNEENELETDDIYDSLMWWHSAASFMNKATDVQGMKTNYAVRVVFDDSVDEPVFDQYTSTIRIGNSYYENIFNSDNLKLGSAWELLYKISDIKVRSSSGFDGVFAVDMIVDILCSVDFVMMTNSSYNAISSKSWLNNSYTCLEKTLQLLDTPQSQRDENYEIDKTRAFFINIMHSFGVDKILEIIVEYSHASKNSPTGEMTLDNLGLVISNIIDKDVSFYFDAFDMTLSQDVVKKMSGKQAYIPVQSKYTIGATDNVEDIGYTIPMGEKAEFDFASSIISLIDGWNIVEVKSDSNLWSQKDGIYYYSPSASKLIDSYELSLRNGEHSAVLYGKINVDIATATVKVYEGWTFTNMSTALEDAIDNYENRTPDAVGSIDFAGVEKYDEEDGNTYVLTVSEGCISVPQSGNYTIYLKTSGLCQVQFGVQKYMFDMFVNSLPVAEYTDYLSYNIELDSDKTYEYKIFMLATKGDGSAVLGIKYNDGEDKNIYDIDSKYLIYKGLTRDDIIDYNPPLIYPDGYHTKDDFYQNYELTTDNFVSYPEAVVNNDMDFALDSLSNSYYVAYNKANSYEFIIDLGSEKRVEYLSFVAKESMQGAKIQIYSASKNQAKKYEQVSLQDEDYTLTNGENIVMFRAATNRFIKIVISQENVFECAFSDFSIGQYFEESQIVTNTSSSLSYMGGWSDIQGYVSVNGSISQSTDKNSIMSFTAKCRQVAFYGVKDSNFGKMDVYVDGKLYTTVDLYSENTMTDTLLFAIDFEYSLEHSIKVMPASDEDIINIDYISYIPVEEEEIYQNTGTLYYALIVPVLVAIALIGAFIADKVKKNKQNNK